MIFSISMQFQTIKTVFQKNNYIEIICVEPGAPTTPFFLDRVVTKIKGGFKMAIQQRKDTILSGRK